MSLPDWIKVIEEEPEELQAKAYLFNPDVSKSKLSSMSNDVQDVGRGVGRGAAGFVGSVPDMLSALIDLGARLPWNKKASTFEDVQNLLQKGGSENLKSLSGLKAPESFIGKTLERAGDYGPLALLAPGASGISALAGQGVEELGGDSKAQLAAELLAPNAKNITSGASKIANSFAGKPVKTASGVTKVRAEKFAGDVNKALISPETQTAAINRASKEGQDLIKSKAFESSPTLQQIKQGFNFESKFNTQFKNLEEIVKENPFRVDSSPTKSYFSEVKHNLSEHPNLTSEQKQINQYIKNWEKSFRNKPITSDQAYTQYRQNNKLWGKAQWHEKEYKEFLDKANESIVKSFESTMGDEKGFVDAFKKANSEYKSFKEAQSIDRALSDVFGDSLSEKSFQKLADPQNRPKLEKSLGKDLYNKVQPIAKDVEKTQSALNSIKAKEFWGAASKSSLGPLNFIVYAISPKLAAAYGVKKGAEAGRHVLGKILSNPQSEKDFKGVLKAIESLDFKAADNAASVLMSHLEGKDQPKEEELPEWMKLVEQ